MSLDRVPRKRVHHRRSTTGLRSVAFFGLALAIVAAGFWLTRPKELAFIEFGPSPRPGAPSVASVGAPADLTMRIDMAGFSPPELRVTPGRAVRLKLVNPDNSHHTDGGGVHGFTVPGLGIDVRVPPETNMVVTLPAAEPGDYEFWCDTCCGGKENPSMQGTIRVRA